MATVLNVGLRIEAIAELTATTPHTGSVVDALNNGSAGERWTDGQGSAQCDRVYRASVTLAAAGSVSYNLLAAGGLTDAFGQAIDLDELKGLVIKCTSGLIKIDAPAANFLTIFADASDLFRIANGATFAMSWGAAGLDVTSSSKFDIVDLNGGSGSTYEIEFWGAQ